MTEREERAEVLRNRTEKDEKEFQNYYATLKTGGGPGTGADIVDGRNATGRSQVVRGFLTASPETQAAVAQSGATPLELRDTTSAPQLF